MAYFQILNKAQFERTLNSTDRKQSDREVDSTAAQALITVRLERQAFNARSLQETETYTWLTN